MALSKELPKTLHIYGQTRKMRETTAEKQPPSVKAVVSQLCPTVTVALWWTVLCGTCGVSSVSCTVRCLPDHTSLGTPGQTDPPKTWESHTDSQKLPPDKLSFINRRLRNYTTVPLSLKACHFQGKLRKIFTRVKSFIIYYEGKYGVE